MVRKPNAEADYMSDEPLTAEELAEMVPAEAFFSPEVFSDLVRARGRPKAQQVKSRVTMRLDPPVLEAFKRTGRGWQTRINDVLAREAAKLPASSQEAKAPALRSVRGRNGATKPAAAASAKPKRA